MHTQNLGKRYSCYSCYSCFLGFANPKNSLYIYNILYIINIEFSFDFWGMFVLTVTTVTTVTHRNKCAFFFKVANCDHKKMRFCLVV